MWGRPPACGGLSQAAPRYRQRLPWVFDRANGLQSAYPVYLGAGELEAKLTHAAAKQGCNPDQLVQNVITRHFDEEARFIEAVKRGEEGFERGGYLTHEQVGQRLQRFLQT